MSTEPNIDVAASPAEPQRMQTAWRVRAGATLVDPKSGATLAYAGELLPIDHPVASANSTDVFMCEVPDGALPELIVVREPRLAREREAKAKADAQKANREAASSPAAVVSETPSDVVEREPEISPFS